MSAWLKSYAAGVSMLAVLALAGCSQSPDKVAASSGTTVAAKPAAPPELVPAKAAFWEMYTAAHQWAPDAVVLHVTARQVPGFRNEAGKAAMWEAGFGSSSRGKYRIYTYSIATVAPDIFKGVYAGLEMPWSGITRDAMPVDTSLFNVDSDAAYKAATEDAAAWLKKNPEKPLSTFAIGDTYKYQVPVWYLMWGDKKSGYAALVDASSGKVLKHN